MKSANRSVRMRRSSARYVAARLAMRRSRSTPRGRLNARATMAAVIDPTDAPAITSGCRCTSLKALRTPIWYTPRNTPPLNRRLTSGLRSPGTSFRCPGHPATRWKFGVSPRGFRRSRSYSDSPAGSADTSEAAALGQRGWTGPCTGTRHAPRQAGLARTEMLLDRAPTRDERTSEPRLRARARRRTGLVEGLPDGRLHHDLERRPAAFGNGLRDERPTLFVRLRGEQVPIQRNRRIWLDRVHPGPDVALRGVGSAAGGREQHAAARNALRVQLGEATFQRGVPEALQVQRATHYVHQSREMAERRRVELGSADG